MFRPRLRTCAPFFDVNCDVLPGAEGNHQTPERGVAGVPCQASSSTGSSSRLTPADPLNGPIARAREGPR
jgi:hypothetical protein